MIFDVGPFALKGAVTDTNYGRGGFCPRRTVLDKLLVDAAVGCRRGDCEKGSPFEALLWDGDRVAGIKGHNRTGGAVEERARVVIGADGVHSLVAKAVRAPEYDAKPPLTTNYYSYYSGFAADDLEATSATTSCWLLPDTRRPHTDRRVVAQQQIRGNTRRYRRVTSGRLRVDTQRGGAAGTHDVKRSGSEPPAWPTTSASRTDRVWALVGDAGYDKDPMRRRGSATLSSMRRR